ncbi:RHTO0S28e01156g1_1 [Rhodotorula toruloides]|uniref:RHTO0S28e01156g1_1 n=1 Tax=Rhodotorula toruloides TaxID=5286 RepID=A0A061BNP5_RHOTO|nr:RHTO0S28e01156g1_1 [Rhodotorula toruloides]
MDDGRWDRMADKTVEELQNPYSVLADPLNTNLLIQFYHAVRHAPPRLYDLQAVLRQRVPAIDNLYATWPDTPPLYHVTQLIQGISPAPPPRQARHSVELGQLSCLKADPPANVPPRDPTAPSCPTVDYVVERSDFIERETGHTMHFAEVFRVCVKPMFVARSRRLGLAATSKPTARYYFIAQLIQAIEQISQTVRHSADTVSITLYGEYAQAFGDIRPRPRKINLTDVRCASFYFNSYVFITYHPSVMMASRHPVVRSLLLGRECAQDKLFRGINTPFDVLYFQRAFRLDIEVDELDNMVQELSLDLNNLPETLNTISRALSDYVAVHGNGMRGKPGPYRYRGLRGSGGSCSLAGKRQTVVSKGLAKSDTPLADVHVLYPLAMDSTEEMVGALQANGFELDDVVEPDEIKQVYLTALPSLRLRAAVVALGGSSLNDLLLDNVHVQQPTSASELLKLFEMGLSHDDLVKQLLDALSMTDQATASPPTFSVRATASTSSEHARTAADRVRRCLDAVEGGVPGRRRSTSSSRRRSSPSQVPSSAVYRSPMRRSGRRPFRRPRSAGDPVDSGARQGSSPPSSRSRPSPVSFSHPSVTGPSKNPIECTARCPAITLPRLAAVSLPQPTAISFPRPSAVALPHFRHSGRQGG